VVAAVLVRGPDTCKEPRRGPRALECLLLFPSRESLRELRGVVRAIFAEQAEFPSQPSAFATSSATTQAMALRRFQL